MALREDIPILIKRWEDLKPLLNHNARLFNIYEGELKPEVIAVFKQTLALQSFTAMRDRVAPINILIKIIDKLSRIYPPWRTISVDGEKNDSDTDLLEWYEENMRVNQKMNITNEFFNLFKNTLTQVFISKGKPRLRPIPSHQFFVWSNDQVEPTEPTHIVTIFDDMDPNTMQPIKVFHVYTDEEVAIFDEKKRIRSIVPNPFGIIPFVYTNRSQNLLIPKPDTDTLTMSILIPVLLSDLNYAVKFQTFSIIAGTNISDANLKMAPNAIWLIKQDPDTEGEPKLQVIKPEVNITEVLGLIQGELAFWLNSRGIKPGAIGKIGQDNFASGISKMIDEIDTSDERNKQVHLTCMNFQCLWDVKSNIEYYILNGCV